MFDFSHPTLSRSEHRPWPLPQSPWNMTQSWQTLLFAHWRVPPAMIQQALPAGLRVDLYRGEAWAAVVPFVLRIRPRFLPPCPTATYFPEINVRTYVTDGVRPGVWFFSLDADSRLAVWGARRFYRLPYFYARMAALQSADEVRYASRRQEGGADFRGRYGPAGDPFTATPGSLEHFLTERYCLYSSDPQGGLWRADIHHGPWPLQPAWAEIEENSMFAPPQLTTVGEPLLHYAHTLQVVSWPLERVAGRISDPAVAFAPLPAPYCPEGT